MSIDAAISRIDQILGMERQLLGPAAAAANPAALNGAGGTSPASGTAAGSFANSLASAQASSGGASVNAAGYVNPLANASVRAERPKTPRRTVFPGRAII